MFIFSTITEALHIITSRQKLKQVLSTPLYRNAIYLISNSIVVGFFSFFFWVVVARFYTEVDVGYGAAIISAAALLASLSLVGVNLSLVRFLPQTEKPQELINFCLTLCCLICLVVVGIFLASIDFWSPALSFIKENAIYLAIFVVLTVALSLTSVIGAVFIARRRADFVLFNNTISSIIKIPLLFAFVWVFHSFGIVASWSGAFGIALIISLLLFMPKVQSHYKLMPILKLNLVKGIWQYSVGTYLAFLLMTIPILVLPIMVVNLLGPEQNAYFYIGWTVGTLLFTASTSIGLSLFAEGSHFEDKLRENIIKSVKFILVLLIPAIILLILVGKWVLLAFGQGYSVNALHLVWIFAISTLPLSINFIYTSILRVIMRIKELVIIWGFVAVALLLVSYLILPIIGIIGIGYAWLGAHCLLSIYVLTFGRRLWKWEAIR